jgi:lipoprotein-anchoring transpeptidase ErfK/SrfK
LADRLTLPQASIVGAALLANAVAGYGLVMLDERMGTAHLSPAQIQALRFPDQPPPASAAPSASPSPAPAAKPTASAEPPQSTAEDSPAAPEAFNYVAPPAYLATAAGPPPTDRRFVIKRILPIDGPIRYGEWHWDESGVPPGPLVVTVDLKARVISVFRSGYEIGTAAVLLGTGEYPTPTGVFPISQKDAHHISNLYNAPMPWMLRLTSDGVTIHGSNVQNGFASHGCIGVPIGFAKTLFGEVHLGDLVFITRGKQVGLGDSLIDR